LIATHLGIVDEEQIDNMSYVFFEQVLAELGHKLTYDAIVNYAGNSFCEKSWEMITRTNPMTLKSGQDTGINSVLNLMAKTGVKIGKFEGTRHTSEWRDTDNTDHTDTGQNTEE